MQQEYFLGCRIGLDKNKDEVITGYYDRGGNMLLNSLISKKREDIIRLGFNHGVKNIRIFGSAARGEAKDISDVDFLVDFDDSRSLFDLIAFKNDLEELLGRKVDVVTEDSVHWYIKDKIFKEAVDI